jgi:hypothetical protein
MKPEVPGSNPGHESWLFIIIVIINDIRTIYVCLSVI